MFLWLKSKLASIFLPVLMVGLIRMDMAVSVDHLSPIQLMHRTRAAENILIRSFLNRIAEYPLRMKARGGDPTS